MKERVLGPEHSEIGVLLSNLAVMHGQAGRPDDATDCYRKALPLLTGSLGDQHPTATTCRGNMAALTAQSESGTPEPEGSSTSCIDRIRRPPSTAAIFAADHPDRINNVDQIVNVDQIAPVNRVIDAFEASSGGEDMQNFTRRSMFVVVLLTFTAVLAACSSSESNRAGQAAPSTATVSVTASPPPTTPSDASLPTDTARMATAVPTAAPNEFTSIRYKFRVALTGDWLEGDAQVDWDGAKLQGTDSPAFANFSDQTADRTLVVGAVPVLKGLTLAKWQAAMVAAAPSGCSNSQSVDNTTLGGEPALAWTSTCSDGANVNKLASLHGNHGYIFFLASHMNNDAADRQIFESIRHSFRFAR